MSKFFLLPRGYFDGGFNLEKYLSEKYPIGSTIEEVEPGIHYIKFNYGCKPIETIKGKKWVYQDVEFSTEWYYYKERRIPRDFNVKNASLYYEDTCVSVNVPLIEKGVSIPVTETFFFVDYGVEKQWVNFSKIVNHPTIEDKKLAKLFFAKFIEYNSKDEELFLYYKF